VYKVSATADTVGIKRRREECSLTSGGNGGKARPFIHRVFSTDTPALTHKNSTFTLFHMANYY